MAHITIEVIDEQGNLVTLADNEITCWAQGVRLLGLENADMRDTSSQTDNRQRARAGRLLAYIARGERAGAAVIRFTSPLLGSAEVQVNVEGEE